MDAVIRNPLSAPLPKRMKAIAMYAYRLTATPHALHEDDVTVLRKAGLSDLEIADVNWICGYFNLMNRIAQGLGLDAKTAGGALPLE